MCNPLGAASTSIVEWSAIERCRSDYEIERVHLEAAEVLRKFGEFNPSSQEARERQIHSFLRDSFPSLLSSSSASASASASFSATRRPSREYRLGFDVAASGQGSLAVFYLDESEGSDLWLRALLSARTEDWNFLKTALFFFLENLRYLEAAGDESGLGRQICWEAAKQFPGRFLKVNFSGKKHDLGFALMNQLSVAEKRFPRNQPDIAADYFALRKLCTGSRWVFTEGRNTLNATSHCDIAWAGALASHVHGEQPRASMACLLLDNGMIWHSDGRIVPCPDPPGYH
jgi:hypothetical protein